MYRYAHVNVNAEGFGTASFGEHQEIIDKYAAKGYRFVTWIPTYMTSHGVVKTMDLYFEKEFTDAEEI